MRVPRAAIFMLVNLFRAPMRLDAVGELVAAAARRAGNTVLQQTT
jgi:hypothetical protein